MFSFKYYDSYKAIKAAQGESAHSGGASPFDLNVLGADSWQRRLRLRATEWLLRIAFAFFRAVWPIPRFGRFVIVSRAEDVRYVLSRPALFEVPYGPEMTELAGGENFVLGLEDPGHKWQNAIIRNAIHHGDPALVAAMSRQCARALIDASGGRIDVMQDLITRVATETCSQYFGIRFDDPDAFAEWSMSISALLFADPFGDAATRRLALNGAARVRAVIDRSIHKPGSIAPDSVLARLIAAQSHDSKLTDAKIKAIMVGLVTGFIPTNTLAAGKILQELLRRPDARTAATDAARAAEEFEKKGTSETNPHKEKLEAILFEAARLNPALAPGQWRYAPNQTAIISGGRTISIAKGSVLMVATMSALRDSRAVKRPSRFDSGRKCSDIALMFGEGTHECLGKYLAMKQITEIFQVLLAQENWKVAAGAGGTLRWTGPFPRHLEVEFKSARPAAVPQMLTICAPLNPGATAKQLEQMICGLDDDAMDAALRKTGIVHFASLSAIEAGDAEKPNPTLIFEINADGTKAEAISRVAECTQALLKPIFDHTPEGGTDLARTFASYAIDLKTRPWGATGLNFNGTGEFSVADIEMQQRLAVFARKALGLFLEPHASLGSRAMPAVRFIRDIVRQHPRYVNAAKARDEDGDRLADLLKAGAAFKDDLLLPGSRRLQISDWKDRTREDAFYYFLKSRDFRWIAGPFLAISLIMSFGIYHAIGFNVWLGFPGQILLSLTGGLLSAAMLAIAIAILFVLRLRWLERTDVPDDRDPKLKDIAAVAARENQPGHAQNHFMAVTLLKPGPFRKLTLALSLWGIRQMVEHAYRPGFVLNMGTIHYAKWFRLPKTDKLIFLSNFDGSWESYLEDFIMKAHPGQTAAWSNGVGFPKTNLLIYDGAKDGDRFKRWVRRQQVPTQFWYSRFPDLTTDQIRNNAVIHQGLARAHTDSAARSLLDCFGSMQQPDSAMETEEIQSLAFAGFKHFPCASYALVRLPDHAGTRAGWLDALVPHPILSNGERSAAPQNCEVTFGDHPFSANWRLREQATFVAFSASGLKKLGLAADAAGDGLSTFPSAFNFGMHNRGRILGDQHTQFPWRWSDTAREDDKTGIPTADAIVIVYSDDITQCKAALATHERLLGGGSFIDVIHSEPIDKHLPPKERVLREHFGFRDGISQPVIRGTQRAVDGPHDRDIVEPGEFILGYRNNQGYNTPPIRVAAETDIDDRLPNVIDGPASPFPSFETAHGEVRDFGRNGSFMVVRQIQQHVETFDRFTHRTAKRINDRYNGASKTVGANVTPDWVAAKMMGRWKDGAPLVLRPGPGRHPVDPENDFTFADDDPQGLRCPFGAHIRRANPRDGLRPDDDMQQAITNRHRMLRRGRPYEISKEDAARRGDAKPEKGLVFTCLCTDLERQFEFVQQTWIGSSSFHGLTGEVDPIIGWPTKGAVFTIPTPSGPMTVEDLERFVTVKAGGYFFIPSRSAIHYLKDKCQAAAATQVPAHAPAATPPAPSSAAAYAQGTCSRVDA